MSGQPYIDGATLDEARELRRQGHSLASLASRLSIDPEALGTVLGEPAWKIVPAEPAATSVDEKPEPQAVTPDFARCPITELPSLLHELIRDEYTELEDVIEQVVRDLCSTTVFSGTAEARAAVAGTAARKLAAAIQLDRRKSAAYSQHEHVPF